MIKRSNIIHAANKWLLIIGRYSSCLQIPPRENWFQYVRREYATAINFPCLITLLGVTLFLKIIQIITLCFQGNDQVTLTSKFEARDDTAVIRNYGALLAEVVSVGKVRWI